MKKKTEITFNRNSTYVSTYYQLDELKKSFGHPSLAMYTHTDPEWIEKITARVCVQGVGGGGDKQKKKRSSALVVRYNQYKYIAQEGYLPYYPSSLPWIHHRCAACMVCVWRR